MKIENIAQNLLSFIVAAALFLINLFCFGQVNGFMQALSAQYNQNAAKSQLKLSLNLGPTVYDILTIHYTFTLVCLSIYIAISFFEKRKWQYLISTIICLLVAVQYTALLDLKYHYIDDNLKTFGYSPWMYTSLSFDWLCLVAISMMFIYEVVGLVNSFRSLPK